MIRLFASLVLLGSAFAMPAFGQQGTGISSTAISRCAGRAGLDTRQADAAFGFIALDGIPWVTIERTEEHVGSQPISTTVTGTGARRRRDGRAVPFRFVCVLNDKGEALMFHTSHLLPRLGDELPPAITISGSATPAEKFSPPRGLELRVQLLDTAKSPREILSEQVVRTGWQAEIPFALRVPKDTSLQGRKLAIAARMAVGRQTLFELKEPHVLAEGQISTPVELVLDKADSTKR